MESNCEFCAQEADLMDVKYFYRGMCRSAWTIQDFLIAGAVLHKKNQELMFLTPSAT